MLGALLLSAGCDANDPAPPGVSNDPSVREDASEEPEPGEGDEADASERADSGSRDGGRDASLDAGASDAGARDASVRDEGAGDAETGANDASQASDSATPDGGRSVISQTELRSVERLLVADGKQATFYVLDGVGGKLLDQFALAGLGSVHAGPSGRFGFVLLPEK
ncbi:MAG TPA: hypothetical protein VFZ61_32150, partial [Polyangiales bacterium]